MQNIMHNLGGFVVLPFKAYLWNPVLGERIDFGTKALGGE